MLPNLIQYPIVVLASLRLGLVIVNVDPMYTQRELVQQFKDSGAETVVVLESFAFEVEQALKKVAVKNVVITKVGDCLPRLQALFVDGCAKHIKKAIPAYNIESSISFRHAMTKYAGKACGLVDAQIGHDDLVFLQYTGGTTGIPKGVELTLSLIHI